MIFQNFLIFFMIFLIFFLNFKLFYDFFYKSINFWYFLNFFYCNLFNSCILLLFIAFFNIFSSSETLLTPHTFPPHIFFHFTIYSLACCPFFHLPFSFFALLSVTLPTLFSPSFIFILGFLIYSIRSSDRRVIWRHEASHEKLTKNYTILSIINESIKKKRSFELPHTIFDLLRHTHR